MEYTVQEWVAHYLPLLRKEGVGEADALEAALFGADIAFVHQACYGDDNTPVRFDVHDHPGVMRMDFVACYRSREDHGFESYDVFPRGIARRMEGGRVAASSSLDPAVHRLSVAVHEVRHLVMSREASSILPIERSFVRTKRWTDRMALTIAWFMEQDYVKRERECRTNGLSEEDIAWVCADREFDADVVERLFLHRVKSTWTAADIAAHVRMSAPILFP